MILTATYRTVSTSRQASSLQRAWLISPDGKPFPCGQDHSECGERYPDLLRSKGIWQLVREGWARAGYFGVADSCYLEVRELTEPLFRAYQDLVATLKIGPKFRVEVITPRDTLAFSYNDFRKFESLDDLTRFGKVRRASRGDNRAWMVDPEGVIYPCGWDHSFCGSENSSLAGQDVNQLVEQGWAKVGSFPRVVYMEVSSLTDTFIYVLQDMVRQLGMTSNEYVQIVIRRKTHEFPVKVFRKFESVNDLEIYEKHRKF